MIHNKPISAITKDDIQQLLVAAVRENRVIEYKRVLPGNSDSDKKEFLADVTSFANAGGGDILYGVDAKDGVPTDIPGLADFNEDKERLRLESSMLNAIDPRIPGVQIHAVPGFATGPILIVRIPRSWSAPHMVTFQNGQRFFTRNSAGKYPMDVRELRTAFEGSGQLGEHIRRWRDERLGRIMANEGPVRLRGTRYMAMHVIPLDSFVNEFRFNFDGMKDLPTKLPPPDSNGWNHRFNFDGYLTFSPSVDNKESRSYSQFFRSGRIEAVCKEGAEHPSGVNIIGSIKFEETIIETVQYSLTALRDLDVSPPCLVMISFLGIKGMELGVGARGFSSHACAVDTDNLILPDLLIEDYGCDVSQKLRPLFDMVWNAFGYPRSMNYDDQGQLV